jgi:hypothetical protein
MQQTQEPLSIFVPLIAAIAEFYDLKSHIQGATHIKVTVESQTTVVVWDGATSALEIVEIQAEAGAKVIWISDCPHASITINCLEGSSVFFVQAVGVLLPVSKQRILLSMLGPGSQAQVRIFPLLDQSQRFECYTEQLHADNATSSDLRIVGSVRGNAQFGHAGMIAVQPGLHGIQVAQSATIYLSGKQATASAKPCFDVASKDICCTHGAAIGTLDESQLGCLQIRGINKSSAENIMTKACCMASLGAELPSVAYKLIRCMIDI